MRGRLGFASIIFAGALAVAHASPTGEGRVRELAAASPTRLVVAALKGPSGVGMVPLLERVAALQGVAVSYELAASPDIVASRILTGELDFAALPTNMAAKLYTSGVPYRLAALIGLGVLYVVADGESVQGWKDLRGRTVATVGRGSTADAVLRMLMKRNGLDPELDTPLQYYPHAELAQLAIAGRESIAVLPEPFATKVLQKRQSARVAIDIQQEWAKSFGEKAPLAMTVLVVKAETARRYPELVRALLREVAAASQWVNAHPKEAAVMVEKQGMGFTAAEAEAAIPRCNIRYAGASEARPAVEAFLRVLLEASPESIGGRLPDDGFYLEE